MNLVISSFDIIIFILGIAVGLVIPHGRRYYRSYRSRPRRYY